MIQKSLNFLLKIAFAGALLVLVGIVAYYWFIDTPRSLERFTPDVEKTLDELLFPLHSEVEQMQITWSGWRQSPLIEIGHLSFYRQDTLLVKTAKIEAVISFADLLRGKINPVSADINDLFIDAHLFKSADSLTISDSTEQAPYGYIYALLEQLRNNLKLSEIEITNGLILSNENKIVIPKFNTSVTRDDNFLQIHSAGELFVNRQSIKMENRLFYTKPQTAVQIEGYFRKINPALLDDWLSIPALENLSTSLAIDYSLEIDSTEINDVLFNLNGTNGSYFYKDVTQDTLHFKALNLKGSALNNLAEFRDIYFNAAFNDLELQASASILKSRTYPLIEANISLDNLTTEKINRYWPQNLEQNTRNWITHNLTSGKFNDFKAYLYLTPDVLKSGVLKSESLDLTFSFKNLDVNYYSKLPPLKDAAGYAHLSGKDLQISVTNTDFMESKVVGSKVSINGIGDEIQTLSVNAYFGGPLKNITDALTNIGVFDESTLQFVVHGGQAASQLSLSFPLGRKPELIDYNLRARSTINAANIKNIYGYDLSGSRFDFSIIDGQLQAIGTSAVKGVPLSVNWQQDIYNPGNPVLLNFSGDLNNEQLTRFGFPSIAGFKGKCAVQLNLQVIDSLLSFSGQADLTDNSFHVRYLGWDKKTADRATANFQFSKVTNEDLLTIDKFQLTHNSLYAQAHAEIDLSRPNTFDATLDTVIYLKNRFSGRLLSNEQDTMHISINGQYVDLQEIVRHELFFKDSLSANHEVSKIPVNDKVSRHITFSVRKAELPENVMIENLTGSLEITADQLTAMKIGGTFSDKPMKILFDPDLTQNNLQVSTADGGALLKGLGIYKHINGGRLVFNGDVKTTLPKGPVNGRLTMEDFHLKDAPTLTKMLSLAALLGEAGLLKNEGIPFRTMEIDMLLRDNMLTVNNSKMAGGALILSGQGNVNLANETISLNGMLYPFTQVNSLLSRIPLIGTITDNVRILGTSYDLNGDYKDATVNVKPLSILLPAFVRDFGDFLFSQKSDSLAKQ